MTCATCKHWNPRASGEMAKHRMAICDLGKRWEYLPPQGTCDKHAPASPKAIEARAMWLEPQRKP